MGYFNVCPHCMANLDPGERCDCQERRAKQEAEQELKNRKRSGVADVQEEPVKQMA